MTNKEKAKNYAQNHFNREGLITRVALVRHFEKLLDWKEQQMIEKFTEFLKTNSHIDNNRYLCIDSNEDIRFVSEFIEYFKNYMTND